MTTAAVWQYVQRTGEWVAPDGEILTGSYAGHGAGKNNPDAERIHNEGPLPRGRWQASEAFDSPRFGPITLPLSPAPETRTYGRAGFFIHPDAIASPGNASHGCIASPKPIRQRLAKAAPFVFDVVADHADLKGPSA